MANIVKINGKDIKDVEARQDISDLKSQIEEISEKGIDASGASDGQVPVADGEGSWEWDDPPAGGGAVRDVRISSTSIVTDGVANIPLADASRQGIVRVSAPQGITMNAGYQLTFTTLTSDTVKQGNSTVRALNPARQHESTFYGLAKAAGDSTQSASANAIGSYTESAKSAIQVMLGIAGIIGNVEGTTASQAYSVGDAFLYGGALYKATASIAANDAIVPGTNCEQTTILDMMKGA